MSLLLIPAYLYSLFLLQVAIHIYWLKKGKGEYHKKQLNSFQTLFDEYGSSIFLNIPALIKTAGVAHSQQKMFYKMYSLKSQTENSLEIFISIRNRLIRKDILGQNISDEDKLYKEKIEGLILDRQSCLWEIKEQLGYDSSFLEGISENRISELKTYLKHI